MSKLKVFADDKIIKCDSKTGTGEVGKAPLYLKEPLTPKVSKRALQSSESSVGCYSDPFNKQKTFSDRSFSTIGLTLRNELPVKLGQSESVDIFQRKLKSFYFNGNSKLF